MRTLSWQCLVLVSLQIGSTNMSSLTLVSKPSTMAQRIPPRSLVSLTDSHNQTPVCRQQFSPYQSLTGQTSIKSNTGYALQTPSYPSGLSSMHSNQSMHHQWSPRGGLYYQQQKQLQNVFSPGQHQTTVSPAQHHHHHHLPSPRPIPHPTESRTALSNRMTPSNVMNSPLQLGHGQYVAPAAYTSPQVDMYPYAQSSPLATDTYNGSSWKQPGQYSTSVQVAAKTTADSNHTMFSLAVHLRNQGPQNTTDTPGHCPSGPSPHHMAQQRTAHMSQTWNAPMTQGHSNLQNVMPQNLYTQEVRQTWNQNSYSDHSGLSSPSNPLYPTVQPAKRFVPIFNPKPTRSYPTTSAIQVPTGPKIVPTFTPQKRKSVAATASNPAATTSAFSAYRSPECPSSPIIVVDDDDDVIPPTQQQRNNHQQPYSATLPKQQPSITLHHRQQSSTVLQQQHSAASPSTSSHPPPVRQVPTFGASETSSKLLHPTSNRQPAETTTSDSSGTTSKKRKSKVL